MVRCDTMLLSRRIQNNLPQGLIPFDDAMCFGSFTQRHGSVDDGANLTFSRGLNCFLDIGKMGAGGADDAQPPHVESPDVQLNFTAAVGARSDEPATDGEAV